MTTEYKPLVVFVIVTWNGLQDTLACLNSLHALTYSNWRAILVDNASLDGTVTAVRRYFPRIEIIENDTNLGYVAANNQGVSWALDMNADWILLLNNDVIMKADSLSEMVSLGQLNYQIGIIGPVMQRTMQEDVHDVGGDFDFFLGRVLLRNQRFFPADARYGVIDYVWGCTLMARSEIFVHTNGLNPTYVAYFEDAELCLRAKRELGLITAVALRSQVTHKVGGSGEKRFLWQTYLRTRNHMYFFTRFAPRVNLAVLIPVLLFFQLPAIILRSLRVVLARKLRAQKYRDRPITLWGYQAQRPSIRQIEKWLEEIGYDITH